MKMQMVVAHGGRCAERVVFGDDLSDGGTDDLEKITKVVHVLVYCFYLNVLFPYPDVYCHPCCEYRPCNRSPGSLSFHHYDHVGIHL